MAKRERINQAVVKGATPADHIIWDTELAGFMLRVTPGRKTQGSSERVPTKTFYLNYRINGRERRYKIGRSPPWKAMDAREEAERIAARVDLGEDPQAKRKDLREAPTMSDLWNLLLVDHFPNLRKSTQRDYKLLWRNHIEPALGQHKVANVLWEDVRDLHHRINHRLGRKTTANRVRAVISMMMSHAKSWRLRPDNPAQGVKLTKEHERQVYLNKEEFERLRSVLDDYPMIDRVRLPVSEWSEDSSGVLVKSRLVRRSTPHRSRLQAANAIRLLLLTGARKSEGLSARWEHFDLANGYWTKPWTSTKQSETHRIPLSRAAIALLERIREQRLEDEAASPYVFPRVGTESHIQDIKGAWETIRRRAGLGHVRIHDLRHTYASWALLTTKSLPATGALLGHSQPATTKRYAHLLDDPLREATEGVADIVTRADSRKAEEPIEPNSEPG